jgi:hypothetical protein
VGQAEREAAWSADLSDADGVQAVASAVLPEYRRAALAMQARTPEAEAEARRAHAIEQGRRQHRLYPGGPVADTARERTAQHC